MKKHLPEDQQAIFLVYRHTNSLLLNVKQESCEYQLFKIFDMTRHGKHRAKFETI